jgi:hypothetical protein
MPNYGLVDNDPWLTVIACFVSLRLILCAFSSAFGTKRNAEQSNDTQLKAAATKTSKKLFLRSKHVNVPSLIFVVVGYRFDLADLRCRIRFAQKKLVPEYVRVALG